MSFAFDPLQTIYEDEAIQLELAGTWNDPQPLLPWGPIEAPPSVSVQKALAEGQYTDAQIRTLVNNKMNVLVNAALQRNYDSRRAGNSIPRLEEQQQSVQEWMSIARQYFQSSTGQDCLGPIDTSRMACQVRVCPTCAPYVCAKWAEQARESINAVVNEPYRPPPHIPELLNRPIVRVAAASGLPAQDVNDWQTTRYFQIGGFQKLLVWVLDRCPTKKRAEETIRWALENQNNPSQASHFRQTFADFRRPSLAQRMLPRIVRRRLELERSIISCPVWEEAETQGELMETPDWEYSDWSRYSARDRASHQRNTEQFSRDHGMSNR
ncbi:hypothetical protein N7451_009178 [Penicillium sp. IBT 35674x]|nr:hypothetical protein N7451_009178 [Penicillium sp. IBT 35674x]